MHEVETKMASLRSMRSIIGRDPDLLSRFSVSVASENSQAKNIMTTTPGTHPRESRFGGRTVTFRSLRTEDKELFKSFIRSLPRKDNYYLMVDVYDVSVAHRSRGLGTALASKAFAIGWERGLQKLLARMASGQLGALKLFHSLGFRTQAILTGCVKNENGVTENLVIMSHDRPMTA